LKTLNEMDDLPIYGNAPRLKCRNLRGPWQEIQLDVHALDEIDVPAFWDFLEQAVQAFVRYTERLAASPEDVMPWKKLGRKWHFLRKGFAPGKKVAWSVEVLEDLTELLGGAAEGAEFEWTNQQVVHVVLPGRREPWATLHTKRPDALQLSLTGPKDFVALGRIAGLARHRQLEPGKNGRDVIKLKFRTRQDLQRGDLAEFLSEHVRACLKEDDR
jgi:excinuclease ABC subunit A